MSRAERSRAQLASWLAVAFALAVFLGVPPLAEASGCAGGDTDGDGVLDVHEDSNENFTCFDDDDDGDGVPNYLDCRDSVANPDLGVGAAAFDSPSACMLDGDGDDFGDDSITATGGLVAGTDCDDAENEFHPGAPELDNAIDEDCDGLIDEFFDCDFEAGTCGLWSAVTTPDRCDGIDDDCDTDVDEDASCAPGLSCCGSDGCVDLMSDPNNCLFCDTVCPNPTTATRRASWANAGSRATRASTTATRRSSTVARRI